MKRLKPLAYGLTSLQTLEPPTGLEPASFQLHVCCLEDSTVTAAQHWVGSILRSYRLDPEDSGSHERCLHSRRCFWSITVLGVSLHLGSVEQPIPAQAGF